MKSEFREHQIDDRWIDQINRPYASPERRMLWQQWTRHLDTIGIPKQQLPAIRRQLARTLRRCPLPVPSEWESLVRDKCKSRFLLWVYPWVDAEWIHPDGVVRLYPGRVAALPMPLFEEWLRALSAHFNGIEPHIQQLVSVLWWEKWEPTR